jgi:phage regulator Rha-like protein
LSKKNQVEKITATSLVVGASRIEQAIYLIRDQKVMLDSDLAELYGVTTGNLVKAVKRNIERFPKDFMFKLTDPEFKSLLFQIGISKGRGGRRSQPYVFTEYGVAMLSSVLRSDRAIQVNIEIMRAFGRLRNILASNKALASRIADLEKKHEGHDQAIAVLFEEIRHLIEMPEKPKRRMGFHAK